ncbi:hypothetical protein [Streptomyces werraensis]|uniref:Uncharacterized protein n=1 Tax=Streptomyces werraensis TaxID=68284 RepID=A0ABV3JNY6_9ACTN
MTAVAGIDMNVIARENRADGWTLRPDIDDVWKLTRQPATRRDYPEPWTGYVWPVGDTWHYEIRSWSTRTVFDAGTGSFYDCFQFVHRKA